MYKIHFFLFHIETIIKRNPSTSYSKANDTPNYYTMSPSYQTVPLVTPPKVEPSSTSVPMMKKVAVAAMVGTAFLAGSYVPRTTHIRSNQVFGSLSNKNNALVAGKLTAAGDCPSGQVLWAVKNLVPDNSLNSDHPGQPFKGNPLNICGQICMTKFMIGLITAAPKDIQDGASAASCGDLGYPVYDQEFARIEFFPGTEGLLIPIFKLEPGNCVACLDGELCCDGSSGGFSFECCPRGSF